MARSRGRLKKALDRIADKHPKHVAGRAWNWAAKRNPHRKRWGAGIAWWHMHKQYAYKKSHKYENIQKYLREHHKSHEVVHRAYMRSRMWLGRAHHFGHIEALWRQEKRRLKRKAKRHELPGNIVTFDGHQVAGWIVRKSLLPARQSGLWNGVVFSGFRTPEYSRSLCIAMCGAPTCPGRCAGEFSNHSCMPSHACVEYEGAVDVSDSYGLSTWEARNGYPTRHTLQYDLPHHSRSGQ